MGDRGAFISGSRWWTTRIWRHIPDWLGILKRINIASLPDWFGILTRTKFPTIVPMCLYLHLASALCDNYATAAVEIGSGKRLQRVF